MLNELAVVSGSMSLAEYRRHCIHDIPTPATDIPAKAHAPIATPNHTRCLLAHYG